MCPFLGLSQDSQTALSYPSSWNVCHHTKPAGTPNLHFQQSFCFSKNHCTCPVYTRLERYPLPSGIRFPVSKPTIQKRLILFLSIGGVILVLGIIGIAWGIQDRRNHNGSPSAQLVSPSPTVTMTILPTDTIPFTATPVPPTLTASPTLTLTSTPTRWTTPPTDTLWPTQTRTITPTSPPTRTATSLPSATATLPPP